MNEKFLGRSPKLIQTFLRNDGKSDGSPASQALWNEDSEVTGDTWTGRRESVMTEALGANLCIEDPVGRLRGEENGMAQHKTARADAKNISMHTKQQTN